MRPDLSRDTPTAIAILRGVTPARIAAIGRIVFEAGFRIIEVPLNSPDPFESVAQLARLFGDTCLCGAGTVTDAADVRRVKDAGGRLIVAPNTDSEVIALAVALGLSIVPGFATPSEAFVAIKAGARRLKLFPASAWGTGYLRAVKAVLPHDVAVLAVGGIGPGQTADWIAAGASGFGFGSELFKPAYADSEVAARARMLMEALAPSSQS